MRYGLTEQTIQQINSVFEKHPVVKQAVLYGSRAKGNYKPGSDIDLSLFGEGISQREVNQILDELDALDLPYTMDLTVFRDITHAKFRDHIARVGVVFYQAVAETPSGKFTENGVRDSSAECRVSEGGSRDILQQINSNWKYFRLGDVCKTGAGGTPLKSVKEYYDGGDIPWLLSGEVSQGEIHKSNNFITKKGLEGSSAKIFPKNTVLVAMYGATAGQVGMLKIEAATNQAVCGILPDKKFVPEFLYYTMLHKQAELIATATGNAQPNVSQIKIKNLQIPLLTIDEQKRIVAILDDAFERIDTAIANTEKNIANARELFESYLTDAFFRAGSAWKTCRLGEICKLQNGFVFKSNLFKQSGMPVLRISSIQDELVCDNRPVFADPNDYKEDLRKYEVNDGDLLIAMSGATTGKVGFNRTGQTYLLNQRVGRFVPKIGLSIDYLFLFLLTKQEESLKISAGSAQPNLSTKQINDFTLPFPRLDEQIVFVDKSLAVRESILSIAEVCQSKLSALNELKQSLLQKAFSGELTTDFNPDALEH